MINVEVVTCSGLLAAPKVTDELISNREMAVIRGRQLLCDYTKVVRRRELRMPADYTLEPGQYRRLTVGRLGIDGDHKVMQVTHTFELSRGAVYTDATVEQYSQMPCSILEGS